MCTLYFYACKYLNAFNIFCSELKKRVTYFEIRDLTAMHCFFPPKILIIIYSERRAGFLFKPSVVMSIQCCQPRFKCYLYMYDCIDMLSFGFYCLDRT